MFGANSETDQAGGDPRQERHQPEEPDRHRRRQLFSAPEHPADHPVLDEDLHRLRCAGRKLAAPLHRLEVILGDYPLFKAWGQDVRRGDRVLNCEIDPDAPDRGHGMRGIADA